MCVEPRPEAAWKMVCELRMETREAQKIRTQVIGIKIAFVTSAFGFVFNAEPPAYELLLVPAFASIFFDYLIVSYGVSIKRIGYFCRRYLEPKIRRGVNWPDEHPLWEEAMASRFMKQPFAVAGNLGISLMATVSAVAFIATSALTAETGTFLVVLVGLFGLDVYFSCVLRYTPSGDLPGGLDKEGRWVAEKGRKVRTSGA